MRSRPVVPAEWHRNHSGPAKERNPTCARALLLAHRGALDGRLRPWWRAGRDRRRRERRNRREGRLFYATPTKLSIERAKQHRSRPETMSVAQQSSRTGEARICSPTMFANAVRRVDDRSWRGVGLCVLGAVMLIVGFIYDGPKKDTIASVLILLGAAELAIGLLLPRLSELEIGPSGFKTKLASSDDEFRLIFNAEAPRLERFAKLMCGDAALARELVEEALARTREQQHHVARSDRGAFALQTLIDLLETAGERRWLRGSPRSSWRSSSGSDPGDRDSAIANALNELDFAARAAFLLRVDWPLRTQEVAEVLNRDVNVVRGDITRARDQLKPYVHGAEG
jgi:DNA-directed RNA polymerase specialized sigma24 family protein